MAVCFSRRVVSGELTCSEEDIESHKWPLSRPILCLLTELDHKLKKVYESHCAFGAVRILGKQKPLLKNLSVEE